MGCYLFSRLILAAASGAGVFVVLSTTAAILLVVYEVSCQQFENYVLSPRVPAKRMQLHPAVAFVVAMIGAAVGGLIGAFLALPIGAILQAVASTIVRRHEVVEDELTRETTRPHAKRSRNGRSR